MLVWNLNGVCTTNLMKLKTSCIRVFFSHPFDVPWGLINVNILRPLSDHSCMHSSWNKPFLNGSVDMSPEFTLWKTFELPVIWDVVTFIWHHCNEIGILSLYHMDDVLSYLYGITFEIHVIRMTRDVDCYIESLVWLNQIIPISLQWRYMGTATSHITGDMTVCSCASAAWQQRKSQSCTNCTF